MELYRTSNFFLHLFKLVINFLKSDKSIQFLKFYRAFREQFIRKLALLERLEENIH